MRAESYFKTAAAIFLIAVFSFGVGVLPPARAAESGDKTPDQLLSAAQSIQKKYEAVKTLSASFIQETYVKSLDQRRRLEGEVFLKKPGKMLWNYSGSAPQRIVADGRTLWFYQEKDRTVMSGDLKGSLAGRAPFDFLSGLGNLPRDFQIRAPRAPAPPDQIKLELTPREPLLNIAQLTLSVSRRDFLARQVVIYDPFGNMTTIWLDNIKINANLSDGLFKFQPPKGVEVLKAP